MSDVEKKAIHAGTVNPVQDEGQKEGLPIPAVRRNLVDLAMKFLNNPRVMSHPLEARKAFLRKKG